MIFSEPFDDFDEWIEQGELDWRTGTPDEGGHPPGVNATTNAVAEADNCDTECKLVLKNGLDLTGLSSASMTLYRYVDNSLDTGEYLKVDISSDNGTNWTNIFSWLGGVDGDDTWHLEEYDLDSYLNNDTVKLRALAKASSSFEEVMIDELKISGILNVSGNGTGGNSTNFIALTDYSVYLADTDDKEVLVFDKDGTYTGVFVTSQSAGLGKVWDVVFGPDGNLYASDLTNKKIRDYDGTTGAAISGTAGWAKYC